MNKWRVKAFTIMEVSVVMLIAGLVIGMTYTIYSIVVRSYQGYNKKHTDMAVLIRLDELIKKDFWRAERVLANRNHLIIEKAHEIVEYEIEPDYVVRSAGIIDTFKIKTENVVINFEGEAITETSSFEENQIIDELQLNAIFEGKSFSYHYQKQYSAVSLFKTK
jgi:hypothetical protein